MVSWNPLCWTLLLRVASVFHALEQSRNPTFIIRNYGKRIYVSNSWWKWAGEAILRALASSREPRVSFCEPQKISAKKSKTGHNALIWYLLHTGCFHCANTRGKWNDTFRSNRANQEESDSYHFLFLFRIPYISEEKQGSEPVCQKRNGKFRSDRSEETKIDLSIWLPTEISGIFGIMENIRGLHVLVHCSMASEVMEIFPFFFFFSFLSTN